jgi:hypothetical protein
MEINIINSKSGLISKYEVTPTQNDQENGWSVVLSAGNSIFITSKEGKWEARHHADVSPQLVEAIGEAIRAYPGHQESSLMDAEIALKISDRQENEMQKRQNMRLFT